MGSGFSNPIIGGGGSLVYPSIQSPGFDQANLAGWAIMKDGSAYLYEVTASGVITATEFSGNDFLLNAYGIFFYSASPAPGDLMIAIAPASGADGEGNDFIQGIQLAAPAEIQIIGPSGENITVEASPAQITIAGTGGEQLLLEAAGGAGTPVITYESGAAEQTGAAALYSEITSPGTAETLDIFLYGFGSTDQDQVFLWIRSGAKNGSIAAGGNAYYKDTSGGFHQEIAWGTNGVELPLVSQLTAVKPGTSGTTLASESWHNLSLLNGWTGTARYRMLPDGNIQLDLALSSAAATASEFAAVPAGYAPSATRYIGAGATANVSTAVAPYVEITTTQLSMNGLHAFSTAGTWVCGGSYPTN